METRYLITYFIIALIATALLTRMLITYFRDRQLGQYIREVGPKAHLSKEGTPTMGGLAIIAGAAVGIIADGSFDADKVVILLTMAAFGIIGFIDDYTKIEKHNNLGLTAKQKIGLQLLFSIGIAVYMITSGAEGTMVYIPFVKSMVDFGWLYAPFVIFVEVAMANSVNLSDGLDGLAAGITAIVAFTFAMIGYLMGNHLMAVTSIALAGALLGFLIFNKFPAKIFMGDTGSMALGGMLSAIAIVTKMEFLLPIAGLIYVIEAVSVIIQVLYYKHTGGKRFFRMAPIHHHFELAGMKEKKVVNMFYAITVVCCAAAFFSVV